MNELEKDELDWETYEHLGLIYGFIKEFKDGTTLWYEPITDEVSGFVLKMSEDSIIRTWK